MAKTNSKSNSIFYKIKRFCRRFVKTAKKRPVILTAPALLLVIIIVVILLAVSCSAKKAVPEAAPETEAETTVAETVSKYDEAKWMWKNGLMYYDDDDYTTSIGIDVSEWSLDIDWKPIKEFGIDFVICRVGYRGYGTGKFDFDKKLSEYLDGADAAGLKCGVYFVTQAINEEEAVEEANAVLEKIKGHNITMPIYIDCEANTGEETRTDDLTKEDYTKNAIAFCKAIENAGYRAGVYTNETWGSKFIDYEQLSDYDIWFAKYTNTPATDVFFDMWQYSDSGSLPGLDTSADMNVRVEKK